MNKSSRPLLFLPLGILSVFLNLAEARCIQDRYGDTICPSPNSRCVADRYGSWYCSAEGGDIVLNRHGNPVCGAGRCVTDINGEVWCSTQPKGSAALDRYSNAVCSASCAPASPGACTPLQK